MFTNGKWITMKFSVGKDEGDFSQRTHKIYFLQTNFVDLFFIQAEEMCLLICMYLCSKHNQCLERIKPIKIRLVFSGNLIETHWRSHFQKKSTFFVPEIFYSKTFKFNHWVLFVFFLFQRPMNRNWLSRDLMPFVFILVS